MSSPEAQEYFEKLVRELEQEERKIAYMTAGRGRGPHQIRDYISRPPLVIKKKILTAMFFPYVWHQEGPCHDPLPVEILHAAQELQASEVDVAEVTINTKLKLNFAKLN